MVLGRLAVALGAAALIGLSAPPALAADPPATTDAADAAGGWLARQLVDGDHFEARFGDQVFPDQGLTIDAVFAFATAGVAGDNAAKALVWLAKPEILSGYVGDGATESYAGAHAKLALATQVQGLDPTDFGGLNLHERLLTLLADSGRFSDKSAFGDFSNAFSQSLAILTLDRTDGGAPESATKFLVDSQCDDGGFPLDFGKPTCASDTDATAMVIEALLAVDETDAAHEALDWLAGSQLPSGGFGGTGPTAGENANSTGVAAQALRVGGRTTDAEQAVVALKKFQVGCSGPVANRGAVALDSTGFAASTAPRATTQAILGLAGTGLSTLDGTGAAKTVPVLLCASSPGGGGGGLPITGTPVGLIAAIGGGLLVVGVVVFVAARVRRRA